MQVGLPTHTTTVNIPGFENIELIHESDPLVIYRAFRESDGAQVILKTLLAKYPHKLDVAEIQREFQVVTQLNIDGVIRMHSLVTYGSGNLAIEMEPFGLSLADLMAQRDGKPLPLDDFFPIAVRLTQILGRLHEHGLVHKDVTPGNVLIDPQSRELRLIDFGISSELSRERQSIMLPKRLEGSLPYISPEQTGRMNRDLDYRSDYYSLGVTFFELLTGELPFSATDTLEWVHRHISQPPPAAHQVNRDVPEPLSRIIAKLMAKNAEDRYQSSYGLIADLTSCRDDPLQTASLTPFDLGRMDVSRKFQIQQQLYGRTEELAQLITLFEDAAHGATSVCMVSGYSGVGKSALVNELGKSIVGKQGYLIQGKFDQFQQSSAYSSFALAFRSLVQQLLGETRQRLDQWREALLAALGVNAQLLIELVPELELIIGTQPPVPELPPTEAQNRFQIVFLNFVKVFANQQHPLVIFMDDLQWSDVPTLNLLQRLATARELNHLFIIGAYRSNAVEAKHPLHVTLGQIKKTREIVMLALKPLDPSDVDQLIADTLHSDLARCEALSKTLYEKVHGNPFFTKELLKSLNEDGAISFDPDVGRWVWDLEAVRRAEVSDNVVEFMVASLRRLSASTQQVLQLAACIGNSFDLKTLSIIYEQSMERTGLALHEALKRNIVIPLHESYRFIGINVPNGDGTASGHDEPGVEVMNPGFKFQHDRIQQAAYALIDADRKLEVHLSIGRLMQGHGTDVEVELRLMDIVNHLNIGRALIRDAQECRELAFLNHSAGIKARRSSAYEAALSFFRIGQELLPSDAWQSDYDLMLALSMEVQQCAYLTGDYLQADSWAETILEHARTALSKAEILSARTRQYATIGRMQESIQAAIAGLSLLGVEIVQHPDTDAIGREIADVEKNLHGRLISELIDAPNPTGAEAQAAIHLLMEVFPAAFLSGSGNLFPYLVLKSVNLSLCHGNSPESAFAYAAYGMLLCGTLNNPALGFEYGKLAVAMNDRFDDIALKSRIIYVYAMFIHHWSNSWSSMTPWFLKGIEAGYQSGDLLYLAYSAQDCIIWDPTLDLEVASEEQRKYLTIVKDCEYQDSLDSGTLFLQMQLNFQGLTDGQYSLNDASFDEARCVEGMRQRRFMTGIANYNIYKAEIHFFYDDYLGALEYVSAQDKLISSSMSLPQLVRFYIVAFLTRTALYSDLPREEQATTLAVLQASLDQMTLWATNCPGNFEHLRLIMQAEMERLADHMPQALNLYEQAIAAAKTCGYRRDEALANELTAKYLLSLNLSKAAEGYLMTARYLYHRWGASRKVEALERKYPQLLNTQALESSTATQTFKTTGRSLDSASLDMSSVIKASQAISSEIVVDKLLKTTLQILLENAGGQRGYFVVSEGDQIVIHAMSEIQNHDGSEQPATDAPTRMQISNENPMFPVSLINNALRTGRPIVLNNATESRRFGTDPYIIKHQPKSIICIPIIRHERFRGAIYIENNLATSAFTKQRVEVINLLSAQASISMENAQLHDDQVRLINAQQRFVPSQFLEKLGHQDISHVGLGQYVAREMSVMFSDIRSFTPLTERLGPRAVIELLNRYFSRLGEQITAFGGFIDSYNGDEIMALFDLPSDRVVTAGIRMWRALEDFNRESVAGGGPELKMGLGVNTGPLVLGTVGSLDRLKCGVVGDTVNSASRIEQLTKYYGAPFLIGEHTYTSLQKPDEFSIRRVDRVALKGKQQATTLYEVLDAETAERRIAKQSTLSLLHRAQEHYFARDFLTAERLFSEALAIDPEDVVLSLFAGRAKRHVEQAPPDDWQGVYVPEQK